MRRPAWKALLLGAAMAVLAFRAADAQPDFTGRYFMRPGFGEQGTRDGALNTVGGNATAWLTPPALKGEYGAQYARILESRRAGRPIADSSARCLPGFALGAFGNPYPAEIIQKKDQIVVLFEGTDRVRRIYTDGRPHPKHPEPQFYGHSVGHWEGDTLVVDTVGFRPDTTIADGAPHSDQMHTVERLHWAKPGKTLQWDFSISDPLALSAPFAMRYDLDADPTIRMMEYSCQQNNRNVVNDRGETQSPG